MLTKPELNEEELLEALNKEALATANYENKNGANVLETQYFLKFLQFVGS